MQSHCMQGTSDCWWFFHHIESLATSSRQGIRAVVEKQRGVVVMGFGGVRRVLKQAFAMSGRVTVAAKFALPTRC